MYSQCILNVYTFYLTKVYKFSIIKKNEERITFLSKKKKTRNKKKKDSQLIIRINGVERENFISLCEDMDTSAAREIRGFIGDFVKRHEKDL